MGHLNVELSCVHWRRTSRSSVNTALSTVAWKESVRLIYTVQRFTKAGGKLEGTHSSHQYKEDFTPNSSIDSEVQRQMHPVKLLQPRYS